jgi:hypothetical protein
MNYRDADDEYFRVFEAHSSSLILAMKRTAFPQTYRAMFGFCAKTHGLKTGMFECIDTNNPYSFKVLLRSFIEHYLKFMYIWTRFVSERSDDIGKEYFSFCGAVESQDYVSALVTLESLLGNKVVVDAKEAAVQLYPNVRDLSKKELERLSGQFKYRSILRFLANEGTHFIAKERPFLAHFVPIYAELSSFVHGGPYTDLEMPSFATPSAIALCEKNAEVVMLMSASVFMLTAAAVAREFHEYIEIAPKVSEILDRFSNS